MFKRQISELGISTKTAFSTGGIVLVLFILIGIGARIRLDALIDSIWKGFEFQIHETSQRQIAQNTDSLEKRIAYTAELVGNLAVRVPNLYDLDPIIQSILSSQEIQAVLIYSKQSNGYLTEAWKDEEGGIHFSKLPPQFLDNDLPSQTLPYYGISRAKQVEQLSGDDDLSDMAWDDVDDSSAPKEVAPPESKGELLGEVQIYYTQQQLEAIIQQDRALFAQELDAQKVNVGQSVQTESLWLASGTVLALIVLVVGLIWVLRMLVLKRLDEIGSLVEDIAAGEGDLTRQLPAASTDEIGILSSSFNRFVSKLRKIVMDLMSETNELSSTSDEIASTMHEIQTTSESITQSISDSSSAIDRTSQSIQSINHSIQEMGKKIEETLESFNTIKSEAFQGNAAVQSSIEMMNKIDHSSTKTLSSIAIIHEITTQTNLLSLNASIEAAKAGESGKGFTVVADEMRKLAERSGTSANEISTLSQESSQNVLQGMEVIQKAGDSLEKILGAFDTMSEFLVSLGSSSEQIVQSIQEIVDSTEKINDSASHNSVATNQITFALAESVQTVEQITESTKKIVHQIQRFKIEE